jgi:phage pi2 protein 07
MNKSRLLDKCKQHWRKIGIRDIDEFKKRVQTIFKEQENQSDALVEIYKLVFPDWEEISKINGFPEAGNRLWKFICKEFIQFDKKHHPNVFAGGIWMNTGFSSNDLLGDWEISFDNCCVEY